MADTDTQYRVVRNLQHSGSEFNPGDIVSGFDEATATTLLNLGTIEVLQAEKQSQVKSADAKKPGATTVRQEGAPAPQTPPNVQTAQTVQTAPASPEPPLAPQAPAVPAPGTAAGGSQLTPEQQAVADAAAQVN